MSPQRELVEQIVREVLDRLAQRVPERHGGASPVGSGGNPAAATLAVSERVVTLDTLAGRLDGIRRLELLPTAVVTPSAYDEIRARQIELGTAALAPNPLEPRRFPLTVSETSFRTPELMRALQRRNVEVQEIVNLDLKAAIEQLSGTLLGQYGGAGLVTERPALALCEANRRANVRAVWGLDPPSVEEAIATTSANLLVVDPRRNGPIEIVNMVLCFVRRGSTCV